jgi:TPR repeat protein
MQGGRRFAAWLAIAVLCNGVAQGAAIAPDAAFWQSISNSGRAADYETYLQHYPDGVFAPLVRARLAAFRGGVATTRNREAAEAALQALDSALDMRGPANPGGSGKADTSAHPDWPVVDRQAEQLALTTLGFYRGPTTGEFGPDVMAAIRQWQAYGGLAETGRLTQEQQLRLLREADLLRDALRLVRTSPRGTPVEAVTGAEERFDRGFTFERGEGQPKDPAEAAFWYAAAAAEHFPAAFTNLGTLYARGRGTGRADIEMARLLWTTAAALGDPTGMFNLGVLAEKGLGMPANAARARRWYARGAERHHASSQAALQRLGG